MPQARLHIPRYNAPMLDYLREIHEEPWRPLSLPAAAGGTAGFALLFLVILVDRDGFVFPLDYVNLAFHESGHLVFQVLGERMSLYGGTLLQLIVPAVVGFSFWRRRDALALSVAGVWFFQNFLNIARYMADARAGRLPLVGGGGHDWVDILYDFNLLSHDTAIAAWVRAAGWLGMLACAAWLWKKQLQQR